MPAGSFDEAVFSDGLAFDGSSIIGFQKIHESDMALLADPRRRSSSVAGAWNTGRIEEGGNRGYKVVRTSRPSCEVTTTTSGVALRV